MSCRRRISTDDRRRCNRFSWEYGVAGGTAEIPLATANVTNEQSVRNLACPYAKAVRPVYSFRRTARVGSPIRPQPFADLFALEGRRRIGRKAGFRMSVDRHVRVKNTPRIDF
jgi:hypothetical protein